MARQPLIRRLRRHRLPPGDGKAGGSAGIVAPAPRLPLIDAARGIAVGAMVVYHFCWDLRYFGYIASEVETGLGWRIFAHGIAAAFLFIVGVSLVLAARRGLRWRSYLRRLALVTAGALAITVATWLTFRETFIFFGILHNIVLSSLLGLIFLRLPVPITIAAAVFAFLAPSFFAAPAFDHWALIWIGLSTSVPRTNDFVPLFPWFGAVLAGIAAAQLWPRLGLDRIRDWNAIHVPSALLFVGRHSLIIYLVHQPVLFGLTELASRTYPPDLLAFEPTFIENCEVSCADSEVDVEICRRTCACSAERAQEEGLWSGMMQQSLSLEEELRYFALVDECRAAAEAP